MNDERPKLSTTAGDEAAGRELESIVPAGEDASDIGSAYDVAAAAVEVVVVEQTTCWSFRANG
jgi:hypothetical protein